MIRSAADSNFRFDLVMVDMFLPNLSGEELGHEIKLHPEMRNSVLVMMTSAGVRGDAQRLNQAGFAGYFGKPIPPEDLPGLLMAVMATRGLDEQERQRAGLVTKYTLSEIRKKHSRLLLVEDSAVNREIMLHMLSKLGYTTDVAETGRAAVEAVQRESYGLILMDLHLPDISGVKAIESIRALPGAHAKTSIVVLTAGATDAERERCRVLDVKDFLTKPVETGVLGDMLKRWCMLHSPSSGPANTTPETSEDTAGKDDVSPDPKLVEIFIKEATQRLASLRQAFATSDAQRAAREAHTLKSSSAYFQAHAMHEAAEQLEKMADSGQLGKAESVLQALEGAYAALRSRLERDTI
jgi:CheY-like chemotaxis protein